MHGHHKQLFILLCLFGVVLGNIAPYSSKPRQSKSLNEPDVVSKDSTYKRFKENAPTLVKIFQVISEITLVFVWILDGILSIILWIFNEVVRSSTDFLYKIFGALFNIVKVLEALGFGIKFLLEMNYSLVSYVFDTANVLKEYFRHAVTLVRISLANETDHVYESGSMVLEGVQNIFVTTCWSRVVAIWEKVYELVLAIIDNFDGFPKPNLPMIASSMVAATTFFLESILVTSGVISDGVVFLFSFIGDVICEVHTILLTYLFLILSMVFNAITMILHYILFLVTLPYHVITGIVGNSLHLLYSFWQIFTKQCCYLDEAARSVMQLVFQTIWDFTRTIFSETLRIVTVYIPGGIYGVVGMLAVIYLVYIWRINIISWLRSLWLYCQNIRSDNDIQDEVNQDYQVIDEDIRFEHNEDQQHIEQPNMAGSSETEDNPHKLVYELEKEKDKRLCVICQDNVKTVLLLPCRHVCLCQRCYQEIRHSRFRLVHCPLCRQRVESIMQVFV